MDYITRNNVDQRAIALVERRNELELDLLRLVLADPPSLWPLAAAEGITPGHFQQDDARAMAEAIAAEHGSRQGALEAVLLALVEAGLFDEGVHRDEPARISSKWSIERLVRFSRKFYDDPPADLQSLCAMTTAALVELAERMSRAEALANEYFRLVGEGVANVA